MVDMLASIWVTFSQKKRVIAIRLIELSTENTFFFPFLKNQRLLDKNPSIAKLFPFGKLNLTPKQLQNNPDLKAHGLRVMETIGTAVEGLQDLELIVAILMDLGDRHSMYGAKPEHFSVNLILSLFS